VGDDTSVTIVHVPRIEVGSRQRGHLTIIAMSSHINQDHEAPVSGRWTDNQEGRKELAEVDFRGVSPSEHHVATETLARKLSARQVQMIAIGGMYSIAFSRIDAPTRSTLTRHQVLSALDCFWERERVLPQAVLHRCSSHTPLLEPSCSSPCCLSVKWQPSYPLLARSVPLLGE
jgi:hypothetical protein